MKKAVLITVNFFVALSLAAPANSYKPTDLRQLKETNRCPGCDLRDADLQGANLKGADLKGADLKSTNLQGADLDDADLTKAKNLTTDQVKQAENWNKAKYDPAFKKLLDSAPKADSLF